MREVLHAPDDAPEVIDRLADPVCRIVSFTVTEKGYARAADGSLDPAAAEASFYPLLARGLERRAAQGLPGITLLSCDNLAANGRVLAALMGEYLDARFPDLAEWFTRECTVPSTMVGWIAARCSPKGSANG